MKIDQESRSKSMQFQFSIRIIVETKMLSLGVLINLALFLLILSISGCCSPTNKGPAVLTTIAQGGTKVVRVSSRCPRQSTGLLVSSDQEYSIVPNPNDWWVDFFIPCGASGYCHWWTEWYMKALESHKPLPHRPWCALCGCVGVDSNAFLIGTNWTGSPLSTGELFLFANDAKGWYWNNFGTLQVSIKRTK